MTQSAVTGLIGTAWAAWIATLEAKGVAARAGLRAGASLDQIEAVEAIVGARLPQDVHDVYLLADGQIDIFKVTDIPHGKWIAPIFGSFEFNSLERVSMEWSSWNEIRKQSTEEELDDFHSQIDVQPGHSVKKLYTHDLWIPFATDGGGNSLAFDLDPPPGGTRGQIIVIGSDEDTRRVLAPGLTAFLTSITQLLQIGRLSIAPPGDDEPVVVFDIEPGMLQ
jgi:cell wall assembly regulator SMI1